MWARVMRAHSPSSSEVSWRVGVSPWSESPVLVHAPETEIGYPIEAPAAYPEHNYPVGTLIKDIHLDPFATYYWRGYPVNGSDLQAILADFYKAVRVFVQVGNVRYFVGYVPEDDAFVLHEIIGSVYVYEAVLTVRTTEKGDRYGLRIETREKKRR